ncbi:MAG: pilus assembly protein N-terminal domain-containing protein, partial [Sinorhizobium fredii]|nr:pilus assembly protein N-terminal domain-containing protein [Sinorhizobium fredii]
MKRSGNTFRTCLAAGLSFSLTFSGMILPSVPTAEAAASSVVRIVESGPGVKKKVNLGLNKAVVVDLPTDAHDILVADPALADAVTRTSRRIYLFGKAVGQTNIFVFGPNGEEIVSLDVAVERDVAGLEANLRRFIPDADINVEIVSDNVVLTGSVRTPLDSTKAVDLARAFLKGGEATTRNITAQGTNGDADIFAEARQTSQIVNLLTVEGEDQVTLKVTVAEVSR